MPRHPLDAEDLILVLIDLQEGIVNIGATNDGSRMRTGVAALLELAKVCAIPVVLSCVPTTGGRVAPFIAEIAAAIPGAPPHVRTTANAFEDAAFRAALDATARKTLAIAGVTTEVAVRLAALAAVDAGFHAVVAVDACNGLDARTESAALLALSAAGVELSAVATIGAQLAGDFGSEHGRAAMRAVQSTLTLHTHSAGDAHEHTAHD